MDALLMIKRTADHSVVEGSFSLVFMDDDHWDTNCKRKSPNEKRKEKPISFSLSYLEYINKNI